MAKHKDKHGKHAKRLQPPNSYYFGKPKTSIGVGIEYQAEVPSQMKEYESREYCRWSKWRKDKCKRPQYARKLFTGESHDELLSRLSSNVTEAGKYRLKKAATKYIEGRIPLTRFIFSLKRNVGMNLLIEAVAIVQEERDLMVFPEISNFSQVRIQVPIGNACSSLTPQQILEILNGDVR